MVALVFDFINGFHDAANSIATVVSTRVLSPRAAVVWAAFFNFIAFLVFETHVANTIGKGVVDPAVDRRRGRVRRARRRDRLEPAHLVVRPPVELVARADRRPRRRRGREGRAPASLDAAGLAKIGGLHRARAADRPRRSAFLLMVAGRSGSSAARRRRGSTRCSGAGSSSRRRSTASATAATTRRRRWASSPCCSSRTATSATRSTCRSGSCSRATRRWALGTLSGGWRIVRTMGMEHHQAQAGRRLLRRDRRRDHALRSRPASASRCRRRTPSPARSSASASVTKRLGVRWGVAGRIVWAWILTIPCSAFIAGADVDRSRTASQMRRERAWPSRASSRRSQLPRHPVLHAPIRCPTTLIRQGARRRDPRAERLEPAELALRGRDRPGDQEDAAGATTSSRSTCTRR